MGLMDLRQKRDLAVFTDLDIFDLHVHEDGLLAEGIGYNVLWFLCLARVILYDNVQEEELVWEGRGGEWRGEGVREGGLLCSLLRFCKR